MVGRPLESIDQERTNQSQRKYTLFSIDRANHHALTQGWRIIANEYIYVSMTEIGRWRKSGNSSVDMLDYPARKQKILPNFHFILPKFHFTLPKFYFTPRWRIFICSVEISDCLGRDSYLRRCRGSYSAYLYYSVARCNAYVALSEIGCSR